MRKGGLVTNWRYEMVKENKPNFIECEGVEAANKVSLSDYVFVGKDEKSGRYCFKIRQR